MFGICNGIDSPDPRCAGSPSLRLRRKEGWENKIPLLLLLPVSRTASDESRQNMLACVVAGALANLAEVWG